MTHDNPYRRCTGTIRRHLAAMLVWGLGACSTLWADDSAFSPFVPVSETRFPALPVYAETLNAIQLHQLEIDQFYQHELRTFTRRLEDYRVSLEQARQALERERETREQPSIEAWERKEALRLASVEWELKRQDWEQERDAIETAYAAGAIGREEYTTRLAAYRSGIDDYTAFHERYAAARRDFDAAHEAFQRYLETDYRPAIDAYRAAVKQSLLPQQARRRLLLDQFEARKAWCREVIDAMKAVEEADERRALLEKLKAEAGA